MSGNSPNILNAIARAKELGATTIAFTGVKGKLKDSVDLPLTIPSTNTPRIQEGYLCAGISYVASRKGIFGKKAVFVDRDDTIARDVPYCSKPEDMHLFPGVGASIKKLNDAGYLVVVITNQSGIARGYFDEPMLKRIHEKMIADLGADGARLDGIYYCPHHPDDECSCRKPETGLLEKAVKDLGIDIRSSYVVGDAEHDMNLVKAGCRTIQVKREFTFHYAVEQILNGQ